MIETIFSQPIDDEEIERVHRENCLRIAEDWLLQYAGSIDEAKELAMHLVSVNWQEVILDRERREQERQKEENQRVQEALAKGGGHCGECKRFSYDPLIYCSFTATAYGNFCYSCVKSLQKYYGTPYEEWILRCDECYAVMPTNLLCRHPEEKYPKIRARWHGYCFSCLEQLIEKSTITCPVCGKRTMEYTYKSACDDCYVKYPERSTVASQNNRALAMGLPATLTVEQWFQTVNHFNNKCAYCLRKPYTDLEHYTPLTLGGGTTFDNCVPACQECNLRKGNKHPDVFTRLFPTQNIARIRGYLERVSSPVLS